MELMRTASVQIVLMSREMCHTFYQKFQNDPAIGHYYEYIYNSDTVDYYFDKNSVPQRKLYAILLDDQIIGEIKLKDMDFSQKTCMMGIHLRDDSLKNRGFGTQAERLILQHAFIELEMETVRADVALKNTRSQHVLEKVGFTWIGQDDAFCYYEITRQSFEGERYICRRE